MRKFLLALGLLAFPALVSAEANTFGLRLAGGYGTSMNSIQSDQNYSESLSPGIPASAELLYYPAPGFGISLGGYPIFMNRSVKYQVSTGLGTVDATQNETAVFVPYMVGLNFEYPLSAFFTLVGGIDAGYVPATTLSVDNSVYGKGTTTLGGGFAWRSEVGVDWNVTKHLSFGLAVQEVTFNLTKPTSQARTTADFNQVAPMAVLEYKL